MICILNLMDLVTTLCILSLGGGEANPAAALLLSRGLFLPVKVILGGGCCIWLEYQSRHHKSARIGKWVVAGGYALVCINNLLTIGVLLKR